MWSKEEAKEKRIRFFTNFGIYMKRHEATFGEKIKWVNYKTGVKSIKFRIEANNKTARVCIDIENKDSGIRALFTEQFKELKTLLEENTGELIWLNSYQYNPDREITRIYTELDGFSINNEDHWGDIYYFFEDKLIGLHNFWEMTSDVFIDLDA